MCDFTLGSTWTVTFRDVGFPLLSDTCNVSVTNGSSHLELYWNGVCAPQEFLIDIQVSLTPIPHLFMQYLFRVNTTKIEKEKTFQTAYLSFYQAVHIFKPVNINTNHS